MDLITVGPRISGYISSTNLNITCKIFDQYTPYGYGKSYTAVKAGYSMPIVPIDIEFLGGTYLGSFGFKENGSEKSFRADFFRRFFPWTYSRELLKILHRKPEKKID